VATVYLGRAGLDQIAAAQAEFDVHVVSSGDGQCVTCAGSPCPGQASALRALAQYDQLPRRRPGATRPDRIGLRPSGVSWFARG
jgi:hypothetical protein